MNKLSKAQLKERDEITGKISTRLSELEGTLEKYNALVSGAYAKVQEAIEAYNDQRSVLFAEVTPALEAYNEAVGEARDWAQAIAEEIGEYIADRSEKWQESEKGQAYEGWQSEFAEISLEEAGFDEPEPVEIDEPEELSVDVLDAEEALSGITEELAA